jgi:predicted outer membrane repeat protein
MNNVIFINNRGILSNSQGGAIYVWASPTIRPRCVRFQNNTAPAGGAIYVQSGSAFDFNAYPTNSFVWTTTATTSSRFIFNYNSSNVLNARNTYWSPASTTAGFNPTYVSAGVDLTTPRTTDLTTNFNATTGTCRFSPAAPVTSYRTYVIFDPSVSVDQQSVRTRITLALRQVSTSIAQQYSVLGYSAPTYSYQNTTVSVDAFRRTMFGNNANQIGFVFMKLYDANLNPIAIPNNVNAPYVAPGVRANYATFNHICPFYYSFVTGSGNVQGGTPQNILAGNPDSFPPGLSTLLSNNSKHTQPHQAIIVCDISQVMEFSVKTATYNLGLNFLFENGGTATTTSPTPPNYYMAFQNAALNDSGLPTANPPQPPQLVMGRRSGGEVCTIYRYVPVDILTQAGVTCPPLNILTFSPTISDWRGGQRGWSSPASVFLYGPIANGDVVRSTCVYTNNSGWQQGPIEIFQYFGAPTTQTRADGPNARGNQLYEYVTTSGDMFLNWVYHDRTPVAAGTGFDDFDWRNTQNCSAAVITDPTNPGTARYNYMENVALPRAQSFFRS